MRIAPEVYDDEYFLSDRCEGFDDFVDGELSRVKQEEFALLDVSAGHHVLDAGVGRGELLRNCAELGATVAGIDYAEASITIAKKTLADVEGADLRLGSVTELPWANDSFDRIMFGDVIEHLVPEDVDSALAEFHRTLKPGGVLIIHTAPNLRFLKYGWPLAKLPLRVMGNKDMIAALDHWIDESKRYHVNEQTTGMMRRSLKQAGFVKPKVWIGSDIARSGSHHLTSGLQSGAGGLGSRIAGKWPLRLLFGNDLYARAVKRA